MTIDCVVSPLLALLLFARWDAADAVEKSYWVNGPGSKASALIPGCSPDACPPDEQSTLPVQVTYVADSLVLEKQLQ